MNDIWWQTIGEGDCHLVLLHGWGLNAQVWDCITPQLASHFTLHLVDLPGYGRSGGFGAMSLEAMAQRVLEQALKQAVLSLPMPSAEALNGGLEILRTVDLRQALVRLPMPFLRLYGRLDGLVPRKIVPLLDDLWPESESILFDKAAHAPFVSHPAAFCEPLLALKRRLG